MAAKSTTRENHYVPQWYQEGFFESGKNTLSYLDLTPAKQTLPDGRVITHRALFKAPTSRAFCQRDLYSTFFGTSVNDEIERRLFGDIDTRGARAVRAFIGTDQAAQHENFVSLFEFIDIQKIRTPKGLDWLKAQYPALDQNELMFEMQGIRNMHCTIWTEGVREIVSAKAAGVKFIVTDHPVTIYNHAVPLTAPHCTYPNDPPIALRASQTIFVLDRDNCLILTNLEYAENPKTEPTIKRTFARNFGNSMVRTDAFIRKRMLSDEEVSHINFILKKRARRYIAAGREEWLYPELTVAVSWNRIGKTLLPPRDGLVWFGGEVFAKFDSGNVHYQDQFGRTEKPADYLNKTPPSGPLRAGDVCGCGSDRPFRACCMQTPPALRPSWTQLSIRERNMSLLRAVIDVLEMKPGKDWTIVRRELTDDKIAKLYRIFAGFWPRETDLLQLLPKPDGKARAVYTGHIHPKAIHTFALGASLYFDELLIQHPFLHTRTVKPEFSPADNPALYRNEFLKAVMFFISVMPLVEIGRVNLVPDPWNFDPHLRDQTLALAEARSGQIPLLLKDDPQTERLMKEDMQRSMLSLPREALVGQLRAANPTIDEQGIVQGLTAFALLRESDPLAVLQTAPPPDESSKSGQFSHIHLAPNYEMAMYLAQATGACIITDNIYRWYEINAALTRQRKLRVGMLAGLASRMQSSEFAFLDETRAIEALAFDKAIGSYPTLMREAFRYLSNSVGREPKKNVEAHVAALFDRTHGAAQTAMRRGGAFNKATITCAFPLSGIQDNTINRLLLMSSSEAHLPSVPMAFYIDRQN